MSETDTPEIMTITYDIDSPVPMNEFVLSLQALEDLHEGGGMQLCVKEIRKGSYIFELMSQIPDAMVVVMPTVMEQAENLSKFGKNIKSILQFFKTGEKEEGKKISKKEAVAAHNMVAPLTIESGAKLNIENNNAPISIYTYTDAHAIQNASRRYIDTLDKTSKDVKQNVSLQWKNLADKGDAGNKAVIPEIHDRTVVTKFGNETLHNEMVMKAAHPLNHLWEVTVHVEWHGDRPKRYTILGIEEDLGVID